MKKNEELTNLDYLDFWMRSIHSHTANIPDLSSNQQGSEDSLITISINENYNITFKNSSVSPPILLVGTNKNFISDSLNKEELIKQKFDKIKEFVAKKVYFKHIVEPYLAIDTTLVHDSTGESQEATHKSNEVLALKKMIELAALNEPYMGEQRPLKWMKFEKSLEKLKTKNIFYASLSQVSQNIK